MECLGNDKRLKHVHVKAIEKNFTRITRLFQTMNFAIERFLYSFSILTVVV